MSACRLPSLGTSREYASSYALVNYRRVIPGGSTPEKLGDIKSWETDNLRIIRAFEDPEGSEAGFILVVRARSHGLSDQTD